jgi:ribosomal protein S18 acetylase RimI-like enzyme
VTARIRAVHLAGGGVTLPDRTAVYEVCLRTGDDGVDAAPALGESDSHLMGDVWAGPYFVVEPGLALVAEDEAGVIGYVLGTPDTERFEVGCEQLWWPRLRAQDAAPAGPPPEWSLADRLRHLVHQPVRSPADVVADFPAHLHLNVLPRAQGRGTGPALLSAALDVLRAGDVPGVHVGVGPDNSRANAFWERGGFREVRADRWVRWLGRRL